MSKKATTKEKTSEVFSFRTSDKDTIKNLKQNPKTSEFLSDILQKYFSGKIIPIEEALKKIEMEEMKFRKLKANTISNEIDVKIKLIRGLNVSPNDTNEIMNSRKNILNLSPSKNIIQLDKTLRCFTCGEIIEMRGFDFEQVNDYEKHVRHIHERELYDNEKKEMLKVLGEVTNV